jgi:hypothetical protein
MLVSNEIALNRNLIAPSLLWMVQSVRPPMVKPELLRKQLILDLLSLRRWMVMPRVVVPFQRKLITLRAVSKRCNNDLPSNAISVAATQSPIVFIGTGEHLHDLDRFEARPFVRKMLGMGDLSDFVEKVQDLKLDQNKTLMKNLESGNWKFPPQI